VPNITERGPQQKAHLHKTGADASTRAEYQRTERSKKDMGIKTETNERGSALRSLGRSRSDGWRTSEPKRRKAGTERLGNQRGATGATAWKKEKAGEGVSQKWNKKRTKRGRRLCNQSTTTRGRRTKKKAPGETYDWGKKPTTPERTVEEREKSGQKRGGIKKGKKRGRKRKGGVR